MPFIPATPGIVGFGGGEKPAVFQAIAPQYSLMNQQTDDDDEPPITFCHDKYGDTLPVTTSGINSCSVCLTIDGVDYKAVVTGMNGSFGTTWDAVSAWQANFGTITVTQYLSGDGTCTDVSDVATGDVGWIIGCTGENQFDAQTFAFNAFGINWGVFIGTLPAGPGVAITNSIVLADCGSITSPIAAAYGGLLTVDV